MFGVKEKDHWDLAPWYNPRIHVVPCLVFPSILAPILEYRERSGTAGCIFRDVSLRKSKNPKPEPTRIESGFSVFRSPESTSWNAWAVELAFGVNFWC